MYPGILKKKNDAEALLMASKRLQGSIGSFMLHSCIVCYP
jgi:hypothetical protein